MSTPAQHVRDLYGFAFPDEFYRFREFLESLPPNLLGEACDMHLAFPFDVAAGRPATNYPARPLWEDRYYHDLPEFITLFTGTTDGLHCGYFFDSPGDYPPVVAQYWHSDCFQHSIGGDTLFEMTRLQIEYRERDNLEMMDDDPGEADSYRVRLRVLASVRDRLSAYWGADRLQTGEDYLNEFGRSSWRKPVAETWDDLGIVVARSQYEPLSSDPFSGRPMIPHRPQIEALAAEAMRSLEAGRPGAALKLGRDLWIWASDFPECYSLLDAAYLALGREPLRRMMSEARAWRHHCDQNRVQGKVN